LKDKVQDDGGEVTY